MRNRISTWEIRYRDMYEKYTTTITVKSQSGDAMEACRKAKERIIGWGNCVIINIREMRTDGRHLAWMRPTSFEEV